MRPLQARRCQSMTRCTLVRSLMLHRAAAAPVHAGRPASEPHSALQNHRASTFCTAQLALHIADTLTSSEEHINSEFRPGAPPVASLCVAAPPYTVTCVYRCCGPSGFHHKRACPSAVSVH